MKALPLLLALVVLGACRQEMADMPRHEPLEASRAFSDGMSARTPVPGTVAREDDLDPVPDTIPGTVTMAMLRRGQERFGIYCTPCHGIGGEGDGMIVKRGFPAPPSYFEPALMKVPDRHFYDVITEGYGVMYPYDTRVAPADRWAIVAYIRVLQYARSVPEGDLPPELRTRLEAMR